MIMESTEALEVFRRVFRPTRRVGLSVVVGLSKTVEPCR
jgi:hypothetical protein